MKLTEIANRLREVAASIESVAMKDDFEFPNDMVIPFITNAFVDLRLVETLVSGRKDLRQSGGPLWKVLTVHNRKFHQT